MITTFLFKDDFRGFRSVNPISRASVAVAHVDDVLGRLVVFTPAIMSQAVPRSPLYVHSLTHRYHLVCYLLTTITRSAIFLIHVALEAPLVVQTFLAPTSLPFMQMTNTTVVLLKVRVAMFGFGLSVIHTSVFSCTPPPSLPRVSPRCLCFLSQVCPRCDCDSGARC